MGSETIRILNAGLGLSLQDRGRRGWSRWGVPPGGAMDPHAAECANRLLENEGSCPVLEVVGTGARLAVLADVWVAICGAGSSNIPVWRAQKCTAGMIVEIQPGPAGMWSYLAIEGGLSGTHLFGSVSYNARAGIGEKIANGSVLLRPSKRPLAFLPSVAGRFASWSERRNYAQPPPLRIYPGPQWSFFTLGERQRFLTEAWKVSPASDRSGYRLEGAPLTPATSEIYSEPVRLGSIQLPESGQPIVTMPDGPTVGGYPKIALIEREDLPWLAQCRPGQSIRFQLAP